MVIACRVRGKFESGRPRTFSSPSGACVSREALQGINLKARMVRYGRRTITRPVQRPNVSCRKEPRPKVGSQH